jgi:cytochrome c-type biogenesis protein CcmF
VIVELGHFCLALALVLSLAQAVIPLLGVHYSKPGWMMLARRCAVTMYGLLSISFLALVHAYALSDLSVASVVRNSHTMMPPLYKIAATWGNHEGSMLLWVWMLGLWGAMVARRSGLELKEQARVLAVQAMIASGFLVFILCTSNPFARVSPPPANGIGFNPVLQDPALALHPPMLYAGYVGFSIAFCFAMAALMERKVDRDWARRTRPWVLAAWVLMTAGIVKGAVWAYYELGWGGWWFWDPVENASLMPWLCGTALLHSLAVLEKRGTLKSWTLLLAILAFGFSLLGTFLVRSGVLTSVHAFASDPMRGLFILVLLVLALGGAFLMYALRAPRIETGPRIETISRESMLLLNNVFLSAFCVTVFMGTLYPVFMNALNLGDVSVGPPYYAAVLLPMLAPFAILLGAAPYIAWQRGNARLAAKRMAWPFALTLLLLAAPLFMRPEIKPLAVLGFALGGWIIFAMLADWARQKRPALSYAGMAIAHIGFGLLVIGAAASSQWREEKTVWMKPGDRLAIGGRIVAFLGAEQGMGVDYNTDSGIFTVQRENDIVSYAFMTPEKRWYPVAQSETSETALHICPSGILYLVLGEHSTDDPAKWVVRAYYHPLIWLVFGGGALMALGGAVSLCDRRRAKGAAP